MIIDCISDLHGHYPKLEGGDLLIVAGDLTAEDHIVEYIKFFLWFEKQKYFHKVLVAGNHDKKIHEEGLDFSFPKEGIYYLEDDGIEIEGLKIWGSPWTLKFRGQNPNAMAFSCENESEIASKWALIPKDIDILVTHSPPNGILDGISKSCGVEHCGSVSLRNFTLDSKHFPNKKLHIFGHIHEWGGNQIGKDPCKYVNASYVDEDYEPVNKPVRVIL